MLKIGITGGIGTGKTTVCHIFEILGIPVFYADDESKLILQSDPEVIQKVKEKFGDDIYPDGTLDRKKLAAIVFNHPQKLKSLNAISHPAVLTKFKNWVKEQQGVPYVIKEAALIFEAGADKELDKVIVVTAPEPLRIRRIELRDEVKDEQVRSRIKHQWPEEDKIKHADFIIYNDEEQLLIPQVMEIHRQLLKQSEKLHVF